MKKILMTIGLAGLTAASTFAQGFVVFSSSTQNISTNNTSGLNPGATTIGRTVGAGNFYYALFSSTTGAGQGAQVGYGPANLSSYAFNEAGWTLASSPTALGSSTATAGRFAATAPNGDGTSTLTGLNGGGVYFFQIVGWSANLGNTFASALAAAQAGTVGFFGQSAVSGSITVGDGALVPAAGIMSGGAPGIQAFSLGGIVPTPEPGTMALAALGGASLLLFRRKK